MQPDVGKLVRAEVQRTAMRNVGSLAPGPMVLGPWLLAFALAACGGGGDSGNAPSNGIGTLAYVETECRGTKQGFTEHQTLRIRQGENEPVTVFETPEVSVPGAGVVCQLFLGGRYGPNSIAREPLQWVAVSPDGSSVVFESTDEFSVNPPLPLNLPEEKKGIFWVRADGTDVPRKLGPPSAVRLFDPLPQGGLIDYSARLPVSFSPDSRTLAFVDKGPDADGNAADQVFTIDGATGTRTQVTHLPPAVPPAGYSVNAPTVAGPQFIDERTISFYSSGNPDGLNPEGIYLLMTIRVDGSGFDVPLPVPVALGGSQIELRFVITGDRPQAILVIVPGTPTGGLSGYRQEISEVFVIDEGKNILQLTSFRRNDTWDALADVNREQVYFTASADPLGTNPSENCQLFSIDRLGSGLRQLTNFREVDHSVVGCGSDRKGLGCAVRGNLWQDPRSRAVLFYSNCDPFRANLNGAQVFSIQPDGSRLRQLTDSRGLVHEARGVYSGQIPGPWAYGPYVR